VIKIMEAAPTCFGL